VAWRCFDLAAQYFEEILLGVKKKQKKKKERVDEAYLMYVVMC